MYVMYLFNLIISVALSFGWYAILAVLLTNNSNAKANALDVFTTEVTAQCCPKDFPFQVDLCRYFYTIVDPSLSGTCVPMMVTYSALNEAARLSMGLTGMTLSVTWWIPLLQCGWILIKLQGWQNK